MPESEFPPNSHASREVEKKERYSKPERPDVQQITRNKVTLRKKSLFRKFIDAFRPEDNVGFVEHTLLEVLVPGIKDAFAEAVHGTIDDALGTTRRRGGRGRSRGDGGYTSYNRMRRGDERSRDRDRDEDRRPSRQEARIADDIREVIVDSRVEAEETLDALIELASKYDYATMRDLLSMTGEPFNPVHEDWGWSDLRGARLHRIAGGRYLIDLPRPRPLD